MYWPSRQAKSEVHGPLRVTYLDEEAFAHYTVRRFEVKPVEHSTHYSQVPAVCVFLQLTCSLMYCCDLSFFAKKKIKKIIFV